MRSFSALRFRPSIEPLEARDVPAFLAPITSAGGGDSIAVGDVNRDGRDDVAVLRGKEVRVSLGIGDGTFRSLTTLTGAKGPLIHLAIRDTNSDGKPDVIATAAKQDGWETSWPGIIDPPSRLRTYTVYTNIWLGNGDGTFGSVTTTSSHSAYEPSFELSTVNNPVWARADFNHDGILDLAGVNTVNNSVDVHLGKSDGTYQPPRTFAAGPSPGSIAVGDFNGDGWTDIVVVNNLSKSSPTFSVMLNDGNW